MLNYDSSAGSTDTFLPIKASSEGLSLNEVHIVQCIFEVLEQETKTQF